MARMPDEIKIDVIHQPVYDSCPGQDCHNFRPMPETFSPILLFCTQCAMMVEVRFEDASGS
jgi:hypothetical protein